MGLTEPIYSIHAFYLLLRNILYDSGFENEPNLSIKMKQIYSNQVLYSSGGDTEAVFSPPPSYSLPPGARGSLYHARLHTRARHCMPACQNKLEKGMRIGWKLNNLRQSTRRNPEM